MEPRAGSIPYNCWHKTETRVVDLPATRGKRKIEAPLLYRKT